MAQIFVNASLDYVIGHLRYGHKEGIINIPDEDIEKFKENPKQYIKDGDYMYDLDFILDDYEVDGYGDIDEVSFSLH